MTPLKGIGTGKRSEMLPTEENLRKHLRLAEIARDDHKTLLRGEHEEFWTDPEIAETRRELLHVFQLLEYMDKADLGIISKTLGKTGLFGEAKLKWSLRIRAGYLIGYLDKCSAVLQREIELNTLLEEKKGTGRSPLP